MKRFQVHDKTLAEFTDFATGKMDAVFLFQRTAYFLSLAMANKTFDANIDHDVVADGALGRNQFSQGGIAPGHQRTLPLTPAGTDIHRLPHAERPMGQCDSATLQRLLHMHRTQAEGADFFALPGLHQCSRKSGEVTLIPTLQGPDLPAQELKAHLLQERECGERDLTVFFSP